MTKMSKLHDAKDKHLKRIAELQWLIIDSPSYLNTDNWAKEIKSREAKIKIIDNEMVLEELSDILF